MGLNKSQLENSREENEYSWDHTPNPLQYSCLGNPMDREDWQAMVHRLQRVGHSLATKQQQQQETTQAHRGESEYRVGSLEEARFD